ncbi:MAG: septal ring lytic transglycosylase RlpA family protein [Methyloligellaceae bacterium]
MQRRHAILAGAVLTGLVSALPHDDAFASKQCGGASWYAQAGTKTASGELMNPQALTAAHRSLPFGARVRVKNIGNGKFVEVRINDRGPFTRGRIIDVSRAAAAKLGMIRSGTARVCIFRGCQWRSSDRQYRPTATIPAPK